jgi:CBS domain-containing protein
MATEQLVRDIMTDHVFSVRADTALADLCQLLVVHAISGVPVVDGAGTAVGVVSQTDLVELLVAQGNTQGTVSKVMSDVVLTIATDTPIERAAALMAQEGVHRIPVVDDDNVVVGLLSAIDVLRWVGRNAGWVVGDHTERQSQVP